MRSLRLAAALAALCLLSLTLSAAPRGRIVGPRHAFSRDVAAWPLTGLVVEWATRGANPSLFRWDVTITALDAPWIDPAWRRSNPRNTDAGLEIPVWRTRGGPYAADIRHCLVDMLTLPAERGAQITYTLPTVQLLDSDGLMFETWAGYSVRVEVFDSAGLSVYRMEMWRASLEQPEWTQRHSVMACE